MDKPRRADQAHGFHPLLQDRAQKPAGAGYRATAGNTAAPVCAAIPSIPHAAFPAKRGRIRESTDER